MADTAFLKAANNYRTTLSAEISAIATSMTPVSIVGAPTTFPFRLTIWDSTIYGKANPSLDPGMEIVEVSSETGGVFTISREAEGTTGSVHPAGSNVALLLTAGMIKQIQDAVNALET